MAFYPDISHWKPVANWSQAKQSCGFIISKATEGTNFIDSTLDSFIKGCEANGIPYWLYTFLNRGNELAQAKYMVSVCSKKVGKYFVGYILDVEQNNPASGVQSALNYLNGLGKKAMVYTMYSQYNTYKSVIANRGKAAWWEARYGKNNGQYSPLYPCHSGVDLHQYTSKGTCSGIGSTVDLNRLTGARDLTWFTGGSVPTPAPTPKPSGPSTSPKWVGEVTADVLNVRTGPSTSYGNLKSYPKLYRTNLVDVCDTVNGWYYVRIAAKYFGYVYSAYLKKAGSSSSSGSSSKPATPAKKSIDQIANEVIQGKWGNGATRKQKLTAAGYNYSQVQAAVNKKLRK